MPIFSTVSKDRLYTCDPRLVTLFEEVIRHFDCIVLEGHRSLERQAEMFRQGKSKIREGGKHNSRPALAVDVVPYPVDWKNFERMRAFGGFVLGVASQMGYDVRWGGDWDSDWDFQDQSFIDLPHFELR